MFGKKIKLPDQLYNRAKKYSEEAGYSSLEEFVEHCIEKEISRSSDDADQEKIKNRLKGLGYIS